MKTFIKNIIEKFYYKAFPDVRVTPHDPCLYITKREDAKHAKLLAQIVIDNETVRGMDEQIKIKLIKNEMLRQMEPYIIDSIKISECEELTNPASATYRGTFYYLQFPDCNKIGKTSGFGGATDD